MCWLSGKFGPYHGVGYNNRGWAPNGSSDAPPDRYWRDLLKKNHIISDTLSSVIFTKKNEKEIKTYKIWLQPVSIPMITNFIYTYNLNYDIQIDRGWLICELWHNRWLILVISSFILNIQDFDCYIFVIIFNSDDKNTIHDKRFFFKKMSV